MLPFSIASIVDDSTSRDHSWCSELVVDGSVPPTSVPWEWLVLSQTTLEWTQRVKLTQVILTTKQSKMEKKGLETGSNNPHTLDSGQRPDAWEKREMPTTARMPTPNIERPRNDHCTTLDSVSRKSRTVAMQARCWMKEVRPGKPVGPINHSLNQTETTRLNRLRVGGFWKTWMLTWAKM